MDRVLAVSRSGAELVLQADAMDIVATSVRLPADLVERLDYAARVLGLSRSEAVRRVAEAGLPKLLAEAGAAPRDLAAEVSALAVRVAALERAAAVAAGGG